MTEFADALIDNPILNSPYSEPAKHWPFDDERGVISGSAVEGRRPSSYLTPIPGAKAKSGYQLSLGVSEHERIERNKLINDIRAQVKAVARGGAPVGRGYAHDPEAA